MQSQRTYRIFLSSPGDVTPEREIAFHVVQSINADLGYDALDIFRWEEEFYTADGTFQDQIIPSENCDLVLCIFWKHLGSELPEHYRRTDGFLPTGTEYEFETAINCSLNSPDGVPDVLAYRKTAKKSYDEDNLRLQEAQRARLDAFWSRWFQNETGHFVAAFHAFATSQEFARDLDKHLRLWLQRRAQTTSWQGGSPFRGLKPFDIGDEEVFFGRDREIARTRARFLANAAAGTRFLMVTGPSGAGKSSILRAGVLPRLLRTQAAPGLPAFARHAVLRPAEIASDWTNGLAQALFTEAALGPELASGDYDHVEALGGLLQAGSSAALQLISKTLSRAPTSTGANMALILLIDQFEEIFAWPETARAAFLDLLYSLTEGAEFYCIATMRSEYLGRAAEVPDLARLCQLNALASGGGRLIALDPPQSADLREMTMAPVALAGLSFEEGLAQRIEAEADPKALPALQLLLTKLYEAREGSTLTMAAYEALDGVVGVMGAEGEKALHKVTNRTRAAFPGLVRKLISAPDLQGTTVSRPIARHNLEEDEARLVEVLVDHGLFVADATHIRLAHEALVHGWERLSDIAQEEQTLLRARYRLSLLAARHAADPASGKAGLLQGRLLQEGVHLAQCWSPEAVASEEPTLPAFILASDRAARSRSRVRIAAFAAFCVAVIGAGFLGLRMQHEIQRTSLTAELAQSTAKAAEASLAQNDPALAIREIRRARELDSQDGTLSLAWRILLSADDPQISDLLNGPFTDIYFSSDGVLQTLSQQGFPGAEGSRRINEGPLLIARQLPNEALLTLTPDGQILLRAQKNIIEISPATGPVTRAQVSIAIGPERFSVARTLTLPASDISASVQVLTCTFDGLACQTQEYGPPSLWVNAVTLSWDATRLAIAGQNPATGEFNIVSGSLDASLRTLAVDVPDARQLRFLGPDLLFSAQGETGAKLYRASPDGRIDIMTDLRGLRFGLDAASAQVAYACGNLALCLSRVTNDELRPTARFRNLRAPLSKAVFHPGGESVAALLSDGSVQSWALGAQNDTLKVIPVSKHPIVALGASDDGAIAALDANRHLFLANKKSPMRHIAHIAGTSARDPHLVFLTDGRIAIADGTETVVLIDAVTGTQETQRFTTPVSRLAALENATFATAGLHQITYDSAATNFDRFGTGNVRIGGLVAANEAIFVSSTDGALHRLQRDTGEVSLALPQTSSKDRLAAMSLDLSPDGRFLVATRSDNSVYVHDLQEDHVAAKLNLPTQDSKVVAFAPDGEHLAVLTSAGGLGLWRFDMVTGTASQLFFIDPVPPALRSGRSEARIRSATWMVWQEPNRLAVATAFGDVLSLDILPGQVDATLAALDAFYSGLETAYSILP